MDSRTILLLLVLAACPSYAQTLCSAQLVPLKPITVTCDNAAPICISDASGVNHHWVWGCPSQQTTSDPMIPLRGIQPHIMTPNEAATEAEKLRQLRLQNQLLQQQLDAGSGSSGTRNQPAAQPQQTVMDQPTIPEKTMSGAPAERAMQDALKQGHLLECGYEPIGQESITKLGRLTCTILFDKK